MEANAVYMTAEQIDDLREKVNAIEGLTELRAATTAWVNYHQAKMQFEQGEREDVPAYNSRELRDLEKKYPRAAAFLKAESWVKSTDIAKVRFGSKACNRIIAGDNPEKVIEYMEMAYAAFKQAQEG